MNAGIMITMVMMVKEGLNDVVNEVVVESIDMNVIRYREKLKSLIVMCLSRQDLSGSIDLSSRRQAVASRIDKPLAAAARSHHVVSIALNPILRVQPRQYLLQESISVAFGDTKFGDPDWLVEGLVEVLQVVLEVFSLVPSVVVRDDEVDLAVTATSNELFEPVDALVGFVAVGHRR